LPKQVRIEKFFSIRCKCNKPNIVKKIVFSRKYRANKENGLADNFKGIVSEVFNFISSTKEGVSYEQLISHFCNYQHQVLSNAITRLTKIGAIQEDIIPLKVSFNTQCECGTKQIVYPQKLKWVFDEEVLPAYWFPRNRLEYPNGKSFYKKKGM